MEYIRGKKITNLALWLVWILREQIWRKNFHAYLKQILVDGFFHADPSSRQRLPHGRHRIALLDLGMVGHIAPQLQGEPASVCCWR